MVAKGRQRLSPAIIRSHKEFAAQYPLTDYWEKVDGTRVITLLSAPITISGAGALVHYLPNDNRAWGKWTSWK